MAKKKFTTADMLKDLNKDLDIELTTLEAEELCLETDFIDTGSATMNSILSGSTKGGVPIGKITGLYGPSGCGKSFIIGKTIGSAQAKGFIPIVIDTEGTWDARAKAFGVDVKECMVYQIDVIEDIRNFMKQTVSKYETQLEDGSIKLMFVLDSIGGLVCQKEVDDMAKGSSATDMGTRAKALRTLFKAVKTIFAKYGIPFVWSNHCYDNPAAFCPSAIQNMPGGKSPWYFSSAIVMMRRKELKDEEGSSMFRNAGAEIPIECVKQRFVRPFIKSKTHIGYDNGLSRYYGLFEIALELGVIVGNRTYELADGTKLGYKKAIIDDAKLWEDMILPILDPKIREKFGFGSADVQDALTEMYKDDEEV